MESEEGKRGGKERRILDEVTNVEFVEDVKDRGRMVGVDEGRGLAAGSQADHRPARVSRHPPTHVVHLKM